MHGEIEAFGSKNRDSKIVGRARRIVVKSCLRGRRETNPESDADICQE
jgi:hypothetical protein